MTSHRILRELVLTLLDCFRCGDVRAHLRAWLWCVRYPYGDPAYEPGCIDGLGW